MASVVEYKGLKAGYHCGYCDSEEGKVSCGECPHGWGWRGRGSGPGSSGWSLVTIRLLTPLELMTQGRGR